MTHVFWFFTVRRIKSVFTAWKSYPPRWFSGPHSSTKKSVQKRKSKLTATTVIKFITVCSSLSAPDFILLERQKITDKHIESFTSVMLRSLLPKKDH